MIAIEFEPLRRSFGFGDSIRGRVRWTDLKLPIESIEIRLVWFTKGKGDRDLSIVDQRSLPSTQTDGHAEFVFSVPSQPYSFSGKLISLVWAVEVVFFPGRESESAEIVIGPGAKEVLLYADG